MPTPILTPILPLVDIPESAVSCCDVAGWQGKYAIGCDGTIWSSYRPKHGFGAVWSKRRPSTNVVSGHLSVQLKDGDATASFYIHHLVLEAFVAAYPGPPFECRHLDGVPANNWWWNLAWGTRKENVDDRQLHGTKMQCDAHPSSILTSGKVIYARNEYNCGRSCEDIANELGLDRGTLDSALFGRSWTALPLPPCKPRRGRVKADDVLVIRSRVAAGESRYLVAADFGVTYAAVTDIVLRRSWRNI